MAFPQKEDQWLLAHYYDFHMLSFCFWIGKLHQKERRQEKPRSTMKKIRHDHATPQVWHCNTTSYDMTCIYPLVTTWNTSLSLSTCQMTKVKCQLTNVKWQMSNDKYQMTNVKWQMSNDKWQMSSIKRQCQVTSHYVRSVGLVRSCQISMYFNPSV